MAKIRIGINGFGRIGRMTARVIHTLFSDADIEIVAVNDLAPIETLAHLLKYDSVHGTPPFPVEIDGTSLVINGQETKVFQERNPLDLPWQALGVDIVLECTGFFRDLDGMRQHITSGANKVLLSAPGAKDACDATIVMGVNDDILTQEMRFISNASCTTNCLAQEADVLHSEFGIISGFMTTIHSYTSDQMLVDSPHSDLRRARAAALNMIPTSTGAASSIGLVIPALAGRLDGISVRVPTPNGSLVDLVVNLKKDPSADDINDAFQAAAEDSHKHTLQYSTDSIVSSDIIGNPYSCVFDSPLTSIIKQDGQNMGKLFSWYDNEKAFCIRFAELLIRVDSL